MVYYVLKRLASHVEQAVNVKLKLPNCNSVVRLYPMGNIVELLKLNDKEYLVYFPDTYTFFKINKLGYDIFTSLINEDTNLETRFYRTDIKRCSHIIQKNTIPLHNKHTDFSANKLNRLTLNISGGCNLRCQYCYAHAGDYKTTGTNMSPEVADKALFAFLNHFEQIESIMFFGGEPFLNYPLIEYICKKTKELTQNGKDKPLPRFSVITNGTIYNEEISKLLKKHNIAVTISYDGDREVNNKLRISQNGKGMSDEVIKNIKKLIAETGIIPGIEATYTRLHVEQGISPLQVVKNIKAISDKLQVHLVPVMAASSCAYALADYSPFVNSVPDFFNNVKSLTDCKQNPPVYSLLGRLLFPLIFKNKTPVQHMCNAGFGTLSVASNGDIYPCFMFIDTTEFCMGNVNDRDICFTESFNKTRNTLLAFSDKQNNPECKKCFASSVCSACLGYLLNDKQEFELDSKACTMTRDMLKETIIGLNDLLHRNKQIKYCKGGGNV